MADRPPITWTRVTLDCHDSQLMGTFYAELFGWQITAQSGGWVQMRDPAGGVGLNFQADPQYVPPTWPEVPDQQMKMMHFEVLVDDIEPAVALVLRAGGAEAVFQPPDRDRRRLRVMQDPAGHPFCLYVEGE